MDGFFRGYKLVEARDTGVAAVGDVLAVGRLISVVGPDGTRAGPCKASAMASDRELSEP